MVGLAMAAYYYRGDRGAKFSTYACRVILAHLRLAWRQYGVIVLPQASQYRRHHDKADHARTLIPIDGFTHDELNCLMDHYEEQDLDAGTRRELVEVLLEELTPQQSQAVEACCMRGETYRSVGEQLGISKQAVSSRISSAKRKMARVAQELGFSGEDV